MPNDSKGVKMIYPSTTGNPQSIYYNGNFDNRWVMRLDLNGPNHGNILSFNEGNGNAQLDLYTSSGYNSAKVRPPDHGRYKTQGFMQDEKDWRNVECTFYLKVNDSIANSFFYWRVRGGQDRYQSGDCEACGYEGRLYADGRVGVNKKFYTGGLVSWQRTQATTDIEGRWIGFKFIVYNQSDTNAAADVACEIWIDENNNNNWVKKYSSVDSGGFGDKGEHCNGEEDQIISWGGPIASMFWLGSDTEKSVEFQKISIREIWYKGDFDGDDSGGDDDDDNGGGGTGGSGGVADEYGVLSRYATGETRYDFEEDFRSNSKRWDFHDWGATNYELRGYFKASSNVNDEVSGVLGGGRHSSGSSPRSYSVGIDTDDGSNPRYRFEEDHPDYEAGQSGPGDGQGGGIGIVDQWVGFNFVIRNLDNGVLLQIWQDQGNNEGEGEGEGSGGGPANEWKLVASWVDTKFNQQDRPGDAMTLLRIDGNVGAVDYKWVAVQEILDDDPTEPGQNTGGGGDGGGTGGDGGGPGSGDGTGGTGSGPSTPPPPPPPPREVYQTAYLELMWNINFVSGDPCNVDAPPEARPPQEVFNVSGNDAYVNIPRDLMTAGIFVNAKSVLIGKKVRQINLSMKKEGTPTGPITINIYDKTNTIVDTFDTVIDASTLTANKEPYEFFRDTPARKLEQNDRISIDFMGTSIVANTSNYIRVEITENDVVDASATCLFVSDDNQRIEVTEPLDLAGSVYI